MTSKQNYLDFISKYKTRSFVNFILKKGTPSVPPPLVFANYTSCNAFVVNGDDDDDDDDEDDDDDGLDKRTTDVSVLRLFLLGNWTRRQHI